MQSQGYVVSLKFVKSAMAEMNIRSIRDLTKKEFLKDKRKQRKNILKNVFVATAPNQKWVGDITEFHFQEYTFFICAILDLFSRKIDAQTFCHPNNTTKIMRIFNAI